MEVETFIVGQLETNCYLAYSKNDKAGFLIDPGAFDKKIKHAIENKGINVEAIINTHGHTDHTAGDWKFGYPVYIHRLDKEFLKNPTGNLSRFLKDKDIIGEGDLSFEVIHTPGHTPGGISLKSGNKIFTGDTLFRESIGRADFPYSDEKTLLDSIRKRIMAFPDDTEVLPGHGPRTTIGHERKNNPFL